MDQLKQLFGEKSEIVRTQLRDLVKEKGKVEVDKVYLEQIYGGMRGVKSMIWETSSLDPIQGITFRGYSIPALQEKLPKINGSTEPMPEGLFWLMLVGEIPTDEQVQWLSDEWERRSKIDEHTFKMLDSLPADTHPMTQFSMGVLSLQRESVFARRYFEGMGKSEFWDASYEDAMNLIAKLPQLAAYIYRRTFFKGDHIAPDHTLDWGANFAHMLGNDTQDFYDFIRLYLTIHADHEGGNASAHATHLVGSTLSDAYMSFTGGMTALAGPLHGLANQEVIKWVFEMLESLGKDDPSKEEITDFVNRTLDEGKVIPGYGHAVLREPDPRFIAQKRFAEKHLRESGIVQVVWKLFDVVPPILQSLGKVKNPWPNVDAHSGAILVHYGMKEFTFYTVLFGVSRALGVLSALCWSRALGFPLERPKSITSQWLFNFADQKQV
ncbi:MAG: citrate (Si)-synthase [Saprospiraceae bacterium]|nr:citrate (Si)-synthase [Saprospiraceae bacterium]